MTVWLKVLGIMVAGAAVGLGLTWYEMSAAVERFSAPPPAKQKADVAAARQAAESGAEEKGPRIQVLGDADYDFGSMERYSTMRHTFKVKNVGNETLTLDLVRTTCKCTLSDINGNSFPPGEIAEVTLEWTGRTFGPEPDFYQTAEIATNIPDQEILELKIHGYVTESIRALPGEITVGRVSSNDGSHTDFRLYGFRTDQVKVLETACENEALAPYFSVVYEPMPAAEVKEEKGATSGLIAKVAIKSGLPMGPIDQTIRVKADVGKEVTVHIPIKGTVVSDLVIASNDKYHATNSLLTFGPVPHGHAEEASLHMFIRGPYRHQTDVSVGQVEPAGCFDVSVGPAQELNQGKTIKRVITVRLRADAPRMNRLGSTGAKHGRIVLETTHPRTRQVFVYVKFAVQ